EGHVGGNLCQWQQHGTQGAFVTARQLVAVDGVITTCCHRYLDQFTGIQRCHAIGFRQLHRQARFAGKGGGHHEKDQQQEHHINQWRQVDVHHIFALTTEIHCFLLRGVSLRSPCTISTRCTACCSMVTVISSTRRVKKRWKKIAGMATVRPAAVVINALEIPPASSAAFPDPSPMMAVQPSIMPTTLPSRPSIGVMAAMVPSVFRKRSSSCTTCVATSSMLSFMMSRPLRALTRPVARIRPSGDDAASVCNLPCSSLPLASQSRTCSINPAGARRAARKVQKRSATMAAARIEHSTMGNINQPPDLRISSTRILHLMPEQ